MNFLLTLLLVSPYNDAAAQQVFEPATKISFTVRSTIVVVPASGGQTNFQYSYELISSSSSLQDIWTIDVRTATNLIVGISGPVGWSAGPSAYGTVTWGGIDAEKQIRPGASLSGFSFICTNPPDIVDLFAQGYVPLPPAVQFVDETTPSPPEREQDGVHALAIGPSTVTFTTLSAAVNRLIVLKHQAAALSWLGGPKLVDKLDQRLDQAAAALASGKKCIANVRLTQFVKRLSNAHDHPSQAPGNPRFANDEAAQLLGINADMILARVPKTASGPEEERDCRNAEKDPDEAYD